MIKMYEDEKILAEIRRHWFVIAGEAIALGALAIAPLVILPILQGTLRGISSFEASIPFFTFLFFYSVWLVFIWILFFVAWTNYYLDILIVTNKRIVDIEQVALFSRDHVSVPLRNVEDVKVEIVGLLPSLFKYGDLHVQTAGESKEVIISRINRPHEARRRIMDEYHKLHG